MSGMLKREEKLEDIAVDDVLEYIYKNRKLLK
jgi:hypothetical protein